MFHPSRFRDLVSGRRRGPVAATLRFALRLAEVPYTLAVRWRNHRYDTGAADTHRLPVPVTSVGNLTLGGTGKTPMVQWIARWFRQHDVRVAVVSRGYGAGAGRQNDEALELGQKLPGIPHLQNPDRVTAARAAIDQFDCQLIVLDDAFQHRRIHRDLEIVMLDALEPFGFGHVFPRGTLREPVGGLRRADVVALSRAEMLQPGQRERVLQQVRRYAPDAVWAEVTHVPQVLLCYDGRQQAIESLQGRPVAAFCGVGNPAGFQHTLQQCGYQVVAFREFADHHRYTRADVRSLIDWTDRLDVAAVLCTHKDLVKLSGDQIGSRDIRALTIGVEFLAGQSELEAKLETFVPR